MTKTVIDWDEPESPPARDTEILYFYADVYSTHSVIPKVIENGSDNTQRSDSTRSLLYRSRF